MPVSRNRYTVGCLFAAIGGFCRAFEESGATVLWANEQDHFARDTFVENFPHVRHVHKPIEELSVTEDKLEPVDVVTAGFPCQPFSVAGEKLGLKDERGMLFLHIIRLLREFGANKPKILLLENVQHFRNHDQGKTFRRVQCEIRKAGYWFSDKDAKIMNTAEYSNIPQNRDRIFMVAFSCDHFPSNTYEFPEPLPEGSLRKVKEFLDLDRKADPVLYFRPGSQYHPMFVEAIAKGGRDSIYQLRRSYVRENMSGMCFTLMANMGDGGHNVPVIMDRWGIRKLTPRECARLQGYEDSWFKIPGHLSRAQICKQIGNSVTIPLVTRLAENCLRALEGGEKGSRKKAQRRSIRMATV
jgi:DNA (cytosine-5)-methyltransferase 1